jgi:TctA family transporter
VPTFLSCATEKRLYKPPEQFGQGAIEGVTGPEPFDQNSELVWALRQRTAAAHRREPRAPIA